MKEIWTELGWKPIVTIFVGLVVGIGLIVWIFVRKPQKFRRAYTGLSVSTMPTPGAVFVRFHTYDGLLLWVTQTTHAGYATPEEARELLRRLHRYNLIYGLLAYGGLVIPLLSYFNYKRQLKSVHAQELRPSVPAVTCADTLETHPPPSPGYPVSGKSVFRTALGWLTASLAAVFMIVTATCLFQGEYGAAVVGLIFVLVLGNFARRWIRGEVL